MNFNNVNVNLKFSKLSIAIFLMKIALNSRICVLDDNVSSIALIYYVHFMVFLRQYGL